MKFKKEDKRLHKFEKYDIVNAFKSMGNMYRINVLLAISKQKVMTLDQINQVVGGDFKNIAMHTAKLFNAGLVSKKYQGLYVEHRLTAYGKRAVEAYISFIK